MNRKLWMPVLLAACVLLAGCGRTNGQESSPAEPAATVAETIAQEDSASQAEGVLHITIQSVSISLADLKAQDYTVPVLVTLDQNPGVKYTEWGLRVDPKCTFKANKNHMDIATVFSENEEERP